MGQRHQFFVIARVRPHGDSNAPPMYRCVAAYHHQWSYGRLPLRAVRRLLDLVKQKDNGDIIRAEIREMHGKYGRGRTQPRVPAAPAPFTAFLLGVASTTDLDAGGGEFTYMSGYSFMTGLLSAAMGSWDGDNNDGISVVDVTDPDRPAYCFLNSTTPITAEQYVRQYYSIPSERQKEDEMVRSVEEDVLKCINDLDGVELITLSTLAEAWPNDYAKALEKTQSLAKKTGETQETAESATPETILPALSEISLKPAVLHALEVDDTTELERMLELQPSLAPSIKTILSQQTVFEPSAVRILIRILDLEAGQSHSLDLSDWALSPDQVVEVVSSRPDLKVLNLSHNTSITGDTVRDVLRKHPHLRRLVLLGCTSVKNEDLYALQRSEPQLLLHMEAFIHPAFIALYQPRRGEPPQPPPYQCTFSVINLQLSGYPRVNGASLPFFTPTQVVQSMSKSLTSLWSVPAFEQGNCGMTMEVAFSSGSQMPGEQWGERSVVTVPSLSIGVLQGKEEGWVLLLDWGYYSAGAWAFLWCKPASLESESSEETSSNEETVSDASGQQTGANKTEDRLPFDYEIYDLQGFVRRLVEQGRPPPPSSDVEALDKILKKQAEAVGLRAGGTEPWHLMNEQDLPKFVKSVFINIHLN